MRRIREKLKGKKAHIVASLMVLVGLVNFLAGDITLVEFVSSEHFRWVMEGLGLSALRAGVAKEGLKNY